MTALSQKCFLETHEHRVEIIDLDNLFEHKTMETRDIILLDIGVETPINYPVLDQLLKAQIRPKLLITTYENQAFQQDDFLRGGAAQILFKPFAPSDLLGAVTELASRPHA